MTHTHTHIYIYMDTYSTIIYASSEYSQTKNWTDRSLGCYDLAPPTALVAAVFFCSSGNSASSSVSGRVASV